MAWQCFACGLVTTGHVGRCDGYCFDATGQSCDAVPCPNCGKVHYWTGSIDKARAWTMTDRDKQP